MELENSILKLKFLKIILYNSYILNFDIFEFACLTKGINATAKEESEHFKTKMSGKLKKEIMNINLVETFMTKKVNLSKSLLFVDIFQFFSTTDSPITRMCILAYTQNNIPIFIISLFLILK